MNKNGLYKRFAFKSLHKEIKQINRQVGKLFRSKHFKWDKIEEGHMFLIIVYRKALLELISDLQGIKQKCDLKANQYYGSLLSEFLIIRSYEDYKEGQEIEAESEINFTKSTIIEEIIKELQNIVDEYPDFEKKWLASISKGP